MARARSLSQRRRPAEARARGGDARRRRRQRRRHGGGSAHRHVEAQLLDHLVVQRQAQAVQQAAQVGGPARGVGSRQDEDVCAGSSKV